MKSYSWLKRRRNAFLLSGILIIAVMFAIYMYDLNAMNNLNTDMLFRSNEAMLMQMGNNVDARLDNLEKKLAKVCETHQVKAFFEGREEYAEELKLLMKDMLELDKSMSSVYLYNIENGRLVTDFFYGDAVDFKDTDWLRQTNQLADVRSVWTLRKNHYIRFDNSKMQIVSLLHTYPIITRPDKIDGYVVINLEPDLLDNIIQTELQSNNCIFMLTYKDVVLSKSSNYYTIPTEVLQSVEFDAKRSYEEITHGGKKYYVQQVALKNSSLKLMLAQPVAVAFYSLNTVKNICLVIECMAILFVLLVLLISSHYTNAPVEKFIQKLSSTGGMEKDSYDLKKLSDGFVEVYNQQKELKKMVTQSVPVIKFRFLSNAAEGEISSYDEVRSAYPMLLENLYPNNFIVAITDVNNNDIFVAKKQIVVSSFCSAVESYSCDEVKCISTCFYNRICVSLLSFRDGDACRNMKKAKQVMNNAMEYIYRYDGIAMTTAIGNAYRNLNEITASYHNAMNAMGYRHTLGHKRIITMADVPKGHKDLTEINAKTERLKQAFATGDEQLTFVCCDELFAEIQKNVLSSDEIISMTMSLIRELFALYENSVKEIAVVFGDTEIRYSLEMLDNLDAMKKFVKEIISELIREMNKNVKSKEESTIEMILKYISEHYGEKDISLATVAEHFGLSVPYVSRIFKKNVEQSYSDYIIALRMQKAAELLCETNLSIAEIAEQVGYYHSASFIRVFKRHFMQAPTEYRVKQRGL